MFLEKPCLKNIKMKVMENWNKDDHQGKRKDQVDYSNKIGIISGAIFVLLIIISIVTKLLTL